MWLETGVKQMEKANEEDKLPDLIADPAFEGVREESQLAELSENDRQAWKGFWERVRLRDQER